MRLIDQHGEQVGIITTAEALDRARGAGLDLVEISPKVYGKFVVYQNGKKVLYVQVMKVL